MPEKMMLKKEPDGQALRPFTRKKALKQAAKRQPKKWRQL
jgi:hypothetical protein